MRRAPVAQFEITRQWRYCIPGGVISAVDLVKGIGMLADMKIIEVAGATGNYDTDFKGKAETAVKELLNGLDFVYIHMEAPDECGHHGDFEHKVYSIEQIDKFVISTVTHSQMLFAGFLPSFILFKLTGWFFNS